MTPTAFVQKIAKQYDRRFLSADPVWFAHQYTDPREQEIVAFVSALLAFGNAKSILASVESILKLWTREKGLVTEDQTLGHRWVRHEDIELLFRVIKKILKSHGSIENFFLAGYKESDLDVGSALVSFSERIKRLATGIASPSGLAMTRGTRGFSFLFPSPAGKSPCKRLNMFLRWMVRAEDGIDLGLWKNIPPSKLIVPLDTHLHQFAKRFKISRQKNPSWKMAVEITQFLKTLDPKDPVRFDFAICHYGMENGWNFRRRGALSKISSVNEKDRGVFV
ncbi:MAG: TIGR02757 family protein [Phaeospirillum sp.]|nr:TIGR02757 family protein [Phaeospirillum sp.]